MGRMRDIFGAGQEEVWRKFSEEIQGELVPGRLFRSIKVEGKVKQWLITLDTHAVSNGESSITYTRMRAPYVAKDDFKFKISRKGILSNLGKRLGLQYIDAGFSDFDEVFRIKANDERKVRNLLVNPRLRELIHAQPKISLEIKRSEGWFGTAFPEGVSELYFQVPGVIKDLDRLKNLYDLFAELLNQLCVIGSAYENDPKVTLK